MAHATTDDGVKLYYEEAGSGTPILFIHEFADDLRSWEPQVRYFSRTHRCIIYNARGYPPSDVPEDWQQYSQGRAVDDARDVLDHLDIDMAHIVGLSMGGFASLHFGLTYPEMAFSITVAGCGYGSGNDKKSWKEETAAVAKSFIEDGMGKVGAGYVAGPTRVQFENKDPRGYAAFVERFHEHSPLGSANTFLGVQGERPSVYDLQDGMREMNVPTHIMTGDEDEPCLEPNLMMKRTIPSAWLSVLPQSGHAINLEEPMLFNRLTAEFLSAVESGQFRNRDPRSVGRSIAGVR
ncbi:MAG TPA: alpha/beta hydrolase [Rhodospirillaceae bacterium]|nr:alpha/beta hydrolase [Rhodospirillaceae bacterium]HAA90982.1 alpha/beta hydrolase [Rhodospirillaceae bacterium]HAT36816.1 alpha/beta hydrolase [Rhodospirillaceae bacterium]